MEENSPRNELEKRIDQARSGLRDADQAYVETFKARQTFYEHLMLLNAGTLTLLFTVVCALTVSAHIGSLHLQDGRRLVSGCWMLVLSIVLSLLHNHFNISFLIHSRIGAVSTAVGIDLALLGSAIKKVSKETELHGTAELDSTATKHQKLTAFAENVCRVLGPAAQILTIAAYIEFVLSMRATILSSLS
jgi:hypothetical protein